MTDKQRRFADEYLIDCNATRAYRAAYSHVKNSDVAKVNGSRLLTNANVRSYIDQKLEEISSAKIADATEVMEYLTSVMRRESREYIVVTVKSRVSYYDDNGNKRIEDKEEPTLVEIPAKLVDANKAAELLGKRYNMFTDRLDITGGSITVVVEHDYGEDRS